MTVKVHNESRGESHASAAAAEQQQQQQQQQQLDCDYLVIGAGTSGMSFVDTILTENPKATLVVVDRNHEPGGHWVHVYPYCSLHQTSCNYGVNSEVLGKNLNRKGNERYDIDDRSTGHEVVEYYQRCQTKFEATGRVKFLWGSEYGGYNEAGGVHLVDAQKHRDGLDIHNNNNNNNNTTNAAAAANFVEIGVRRKLVTLSSNVVVPSMRRHQPLIPTDAAASLVPPNDLPEAIPSNKYQNYVVFGAGKTGADAVIYLMKQGVDPSNIRWIVSRDVWYFVREAFREFYPCNNLFMKPFVEAESIKEVFKMWEKDGLVARLSDDIFPEVFKAPTMDREEMGLLRNPNLNVVRMGRASSIEQNKIVFGDRGTLDYDPQTTLLVDCMVNDGYGADVPKGFRVFNPNHIKMGPYTFLLNASSSAAHIAFLECALQADETKNDCCYFLNDLGSGALENIVGGFYLQTKTIDALMKKVPGGSRFYFGSRTNLMAPLHHKGGLPRQLWWLFGPSKGAKLNKKFVANVDSKKFAGLDHCFGVEDRPVEKAF